MSEKNEKTGARRGGEEKEQSYFEQLVEHVKKQDKPLAYVVGLFFLTIVCLGVGLGIVAITLRAIIEVSGWKAFAVILVFVGLGLTALSKNISHGVAGLVQNLLAEVAKVVGHIAYAVALIIKWILLVALIIGVAVMFHYSDGKLEVGMNGVAKNLEAAEQYIDGFVQRYLDCDLQYLKERFWEEEGPILESGRAKDWPLPRLGLYRYDEGTDRYVRVVPPEKPAQP